MQDTKQVNVFVSCPGDVSTEKDMVKSVCESTNRTLQNAGSPVRFNVLDWRDIVGELGGRPQEEINTRFSDYNIYIGILWMRFGAPTGAVNPATSAVYESGTEEEFRIALQKRAAGEKINIHLFFKEARGPRGKEEILQLLKVTEFCDEIKSLGILNPIANEEKSIKFNNDIHEILHKFARKIEAELLSGQKIEYLTEATVKTEQPIFKEVTKFVVSAPLVEAAIPRSLVPYRETKDFAQQYLDEQSNEKLAEVIVEHKRVVLLGSAGSGKSTELGNVAHFCATKESPFVPVYARLNTYVDEAIEDFLPAGWKEIPQGNALIILDGLDEVQPHHFNTAVRKLLTFSDSYPDLRIIVSCRTNFYDFPDRVPGGTLNGFDLYFITDIAGGNLCAYAEANFQINAEDFIKAAHYEGYSELTRQPFFLKLLLKEFQQNGNLQIDRVSLMNKFIEERIAFDRAHFKLTTNLGDKKPAIISLLQRIALAMEYLGRNFLLYDELLKVVPVAEDIQLVKFSTAFKNVEADTQKWGFEHNNIQEFLAANALKDLHINKIKSFLSFNNVRVKPSWLNTLFFLMSIIGNEKREVLIQWILDMEPEVLIKIEPDKIDPDTRYDIFERVFKYYKSQKVWLRSNKFTERELALFAPMGRAYDFLIAELQDTNNARTTRLNALTLIKYLPLNQTQRKAAKDHILNFIESNLDDPHLFNNASFALVSLEVADKALVERLIDQLGQKSNQYVRSGLYQLIIKAGLVDEYIDYFIEGLTGQYQTGERDNVHLIDEDVFLKDGLAMVDSVNAIQKLLAVFKDPFDRRIINLYDKNDVVRKIVDNSVKLFYSHPAISDIIYDIFLGYGRITEETLADIFAEFFIATGQKLATFKKLFSDKTLQSLVRSILEKPLLDKEAIDFVMAEYEARNVTNAELLEFYNNVFWLKKRFNKETVIDYLIVQLKEKTTVLNTENQIDYQQLQRNREQQSFNLFFSIAEFKQQIEEFFRNAVKEELTFEEIWKNHTYDLRIEPHVLEAVFSYLSDFTRGKSTVTLTKALKWLDDPHVDQYLFGKIKDNLTNHPDLTISDEQLQIIIEWVQQTSAQTDIADAIKTDINRPNYTTRNNVTIILWYFIKKFDIKINQSKMLDFTLFDEFKHNDEKGIDFTIIENQAGKPNVEARVLANLMAGIAYDDSWRNNANYAFDQQIKGAYPIILKNLGDHRKSSYTRLKILAGYIKATSNYSGLMELLQQIGSDDLQWGLVDAIKLDPSISADLITYLESILNRENALLMQRVKASQYLTEKNVEIGTNYYLNYLLSRTNQSTNYYHEAIYIRTIKDVKYIPKLIELLLMANQPEFIVDDFNRFDGTVSDTLYNIGLQSEENLQVVKVAILKFITDYSPTIPNLNFYYPMIDRMEYQYYLAQSQKGNIDDAIKEVAKLNI